MTAPPGHVAPFIRQVLAPLPPSVEQASTGAYRRRVTKDIRCHWHAAWLRADAAWHACQTIALLRLRGRMGYLDHTCIPTRRQEDDARNVLAVAIDAAVRIPAINRSMLRHKRAKLKAWRRNFFVGGARPLPGQAWEVALAADAERLGVRS